MTFDVAVVGTPFLDLTFAGLERLPRLGEELAGSALHIAPGGTGMQAIGSARLGLETALVAPLQRSGAATLLVETLESEGVKIVGDQSRAKGVPVTALLTTPEGVAMASVLEGAEPTAEELASAGSGAVVLSLGRLHLAPAEVKLYAVTGGLELESVTEETIERLRSAHALIANAAEAAVLSGRAQPRDAALHLARKARTAIFTLGSKGAIAAEGEQVTSAPAPNVRVIDATGAGDLFVAAYVWAELRGAGLQDRLAWASLYAGLSTRAPTALAGALRLDGFLKEGMDRGLAPPPGVSSR
jgi:sugar/nucleoside kinase (ribokinase family)